MVGLESAFRHRYFTAWPSADSPVREIENGPQWNKSLLPEWKYPLAVLAETAKHLTTGPLHFYIVKDPDNLPEYGDHVVAILWQEERTKIPAYARHVRGIVRCLQGTPFLGFRPHLGFNRYEAVLTFEYLRDAALHYRSIQHMRSPHPAWPSALHTIPRILTIPLGYHSQEELPQIPMAERKLDAFFAGEIRSDAPRSSYRYWVGTSKALARRHLWNAMQAAKRDPQWRIDLGNLGGGGGTLDSPEFNSYSQKMMNTRLCVAPRGSVAETFRMYEGWRAGCMVITNTLPPEPYLKGAPVVEVDSWKGLPDLLKKYARDLDTLEHYRTASLAFWKNHLSEPVIGEQVAHFLNGCPGGCP